MVREFEWLCICVLGVSVLASVPTTFILDWNCSDLRYLYKIKTRKSVPDFSRGHNSRDAVVAGFTFTYTIRTYNH
jgi:hypothetical protein